VPNNFRTFGTCLPRPPGIPVREIPGIYAYRIFNFFLLESWFMYVLLSNITQLFGHPLLLWNQYNVVSPKDFLLYRTCLSRTSKMFKYI